MHADLAETLIRAGHHRARPQGCVPPLRLAVELTDAAACARIVTLLLDSGEREGDINAAMIAEKMGRRNVAARIRAAAAAAGDV